MKYRLPQIRLLTKIDFSKLPCRDELDPWEDLLQQLIAFEDEPAEWLCAKLFRLVIWSPWPRRRHLTWAWLIPRPRSLDTHRPLLKFYEQHDCHRYMIASRHRNQLQDAVIMACIGQLHDLDNQLDAWVDLVVQACVVHARRTGAYVSLSSTKS